MLLTFLVLNTHCWSFWGSDEVAEDSEKEIDSSFEKDNDSDLEKDIEKKEVAPSEPDSNSQTHYTLDELNQMNREEFVKKMEEALKAHETHHLSQESHFDDVGLHDAEFDHDAFLGDEATEFKNLTPEESKNRLANIFHKIDSNNDTFIDGTELTKWIVDTQERSITRRTEEFWSSSNPEKKPELSWDEYRAIQYGFLTDEHISDKDRRWVMEDDVDPETLKQLRELELRDRRRWSVADTNKNLQLNKEEFSAFIQPEHFSHMFSVNRDETMSDLDQVKYKAKVTLFIPDYNLSVQDGDGHLTLAEFVHHLYGDTKNVQEWDSAGLQFRTFRDHNKDGVIDKDELMLWIHPEDFDTHKAEADHLLREVDSDKDLKLSKEEVLDNFSLFVASQATDFGQDLHYHHDEL